MSMVDWSGVREQVAALAATPGALDSFGAKAHRYELGPRLTDAELAEAQAQLGVKLPAEYGSFLTEVGCGGAGPYYGLFPLVTVDGRWRWDGDAPGLTDVAALGQPFPHQAAVNPRAGLGGPPDEADFASAEEHLAAEDAYWRRIDAVEGDPTLTTGVIYLCHLGDAYRHMLVVTGPERGVMWADDMAGGEGLSPLVNDAGIRIGFARWYLDWLTQATEEARRHRPAEQHRRRLWARRG